VKFDVKLLCWSCFWPFKVIGTFCFELSNQQQQYQKKKKNNSIQIFEAEKLLTPDILVLKITKLNLKNK
jgi:hypothetical protein